jgi:hypothetical protein
MSKRRLFGGSDDSQGSGSAEPEDASISGSDDSSGASDSISTSEDDRQAARKALLDSGIAEPSDADIEELLAKQREAQLQPSDKPGAPTVSDIEAAAARSGGLAPRSAPKGGEGVNPAARLVRHPELEPPPGPGELRVAPSAASEVEREDWGEAPTLADLKDAHRIEVRTTDELSVGVFSAGVQVLRDPREVLVASIQDRGAQYLGALLSDPQVQVRIVE